MAAKLKKSQFGLDTRILQRIACVVRESHLTQVFRAMLKGSARAGAEHRRRFVRRKTN
jgi:hypothetical protein